MLGKNVKLIKPGETCLGTQGVTYIAGVSRDTAGSQEVRIMFYQYHYGFTQYLTLIKK